MAATIISEGKKVSDRKRTSIFLNLLITCFATTALTTALSTCIPRISKDLNVSINEAQWLTSGYSLSIAVMTPFTSYLTTKFRTKRLYCSALFIFIIGLMLSTFFNNFYVVMIGRVVQGCSNSLLTSLTQVCIFSMYPLEKRGSVMGWYGLSIAFAPIVSPSIAGILADTIGWRWVFIIVMVIIGISLVIALFNFEDILSLTDKGFDPISLIISIFAVGGITLAASNFGSYNTFSYQFLVPLIVGIITFIIFIFRQLRIKTPFLDIRTFKDANYSIGNILNFILQTCVWGNSIIIPIYVQQIKGKSATISSLVWLPGALALATVNPYVGKLYDKIGMRYLFLVGSFIFTVITVPMVFINYNCSIWVVSVLVLIKQISFGILNMPFLNWSMKHIPKSKIPDATALYNCIRFIAGSIGTAIFVSIITKVANAVKDKKEHPEMFGFNITNLVMTIFSFMMLILGLFKCKDDKPKEKESPDKVKQNDIDINNNENESITKENTSSTVILELNTIDDDDNTRKNSDNKNGNNNKETDITSINGKTDITL